MEAYNRNATPINQITSTAKANAKATISFNTNTSNNKNHNNTASTNNISSGSVVFENGTIMGAVYDYNTSYGSSNCSSSSSGSSSSSTNNSNNNSISSHRNSSYYQQPEGQFASIPEIVINGSYNSHQNLHHQQQQQQLQQQQYKQTEAHTGDSSSNSDDSAIESTALLSSTDNNTNSNSNAYATTMNGVVDLDSVEATDAVVNDEFEQFLLNRSTSDSNILESSIYSELQFPPSIGSLSIGGGVGAAYVGGGGGAAAGGGYMGSSMAQQCQLAAARAQLQLPPLPAMSASNAAANATNTNNNNNNANTNTNVAELADLLNTSTCSRDSSSRASKRSRTRKSHKSNSKAKWNANVAAANAAQGAATAAAAAAATYPPQYAAIFLDHGNMTAAANAMGQIASAAAAGSPFVNAPLVDAATAAAYLQQQPYQLITTATAPYAHLGRHLHHRRFLDTPTAVVDNPAGVIVGATSVGGGGGGVGGTRPAANSTMVGGAATAVSSTFRKCFSRPIVPFIIGIFALGGAACTLGGVVLGATGLIEHTTQYLSASLLMIGIGLSLLIVAGIIWRLCTPSDADECPCYRLMETCRNCNSPYCNNRILPSSYLYPEFQHRPPPPSYLTSLHECAAIGLINGAVYSGLRMNTPPPLYRSTNSLSVFVPGSNSNTHTLTTNTSTTTFTPTTVMPNNNNNNNSQPPQNGPPNYMPPVALPNATTPMTDQLLAEQVALIENLQTTQMALQQQQIQTQQAQAALLKEINYLEMELELD